MLIIIMEGGPRPRVPPRWGTRPASVTDLTGLTCQGSGASCTGLSFREVAVRELGLSRKFSLGTPVVLEPVLLSEIKLNKNRS